MNLSALIFGLVSAACVIIFLKRNRCEGIIWVYPLILASFPVFYWIFAVYAGDYPALFQEILPGFAFISYSVLCVNIKNKWHIWLLPAGFLLHALYDVIHDALIISPGVPDWWPEYCGAADIAFGVYLIFFLKRINTTAITIR